jgi:hypothetical protein
MRRNLTELQGLKGKAQVPSLDPKTHTTNMRGLNVSRLDKTGMLRCYPACIAGGLKLEKRDEKNLFSSDLSSRSSSVDQICEEDGSANDCRLQRSTCVVRRLFAVIFIQMCTCWG